MKTTVEISNSLMREARKLAKREGVTFRDLWNAAFNALSRKPSIKNPSSFAS
jgi:hypothetical protein